MGGCASLLSEDNSQSSKAKKKGNKENPFSFKKFLGQSGFQRRNQPPDVSSNGMTPGSPSTSTAGRKVTPSSVSQGPTLGQQAAVPPDFASDLPDFIQNHFSDNPSRHGQERRQLPDFTLQSRGSRDSGRQGSEERLGSMLGANQDGLANTAFSDEEESGQRGRQLSLPDFLVDSAVPGAQGGGGDETNIASVRSQGGSSRSRLPELPPFDDSVNGSRVRVGGDAAVSSSDSAVITQVCVYLFGLFDAVPECFKSSAVYCSSPLVKPMTVNEI